MRFAIHGAGIAGTVLALKLHELGHQIMLLDKYKNVSSSVAAGILNPITGKRMSLSFRAQDFFPEAFKFYTKWQNKLGVDFFKEMTMMRPYSDIATRNDWEAKSVQDPYKFFVNNAYAQLDSDIYKNPLGCLSVQYSGWLDVPLFLDSTHNFLHQNNGSDSSWADDENIIHVQAHGYQGRKEVPDSIKKAFTPMKGELLTIYSETLREDILLSGGCFICPIGNGLFKVGATYDPRNINLDKTLKGKEYLISKLDKRISAAYNIINHHVGIRPATKDRKPILGFINPKIYLLNGLGSKGVSMAPMLAHWAIEDILYAKQTPAEISLTRFLN